MGFRNFKKKHKPPYTPPYDKELLKKPVGELSIGDGLKEILINGGVRDLYGVVKRSEKEIFGVKFFNRRHLIELKRTLADLGMDFKPEIKKPEAQDSKDLPDSQSQGQKKPVHADVKETRNEGRGDRRDQRVEGRNDRRDIRGDTRREPRAQSNSRHDPRAANRERQDVKPIPQVRPLPSVPALPLTESEWTKYTRNKKWGYIDASTNTIKIAPLYDEIFGFKEGLACAEKNEMFGFIDKDNNVVVPFEYELALSFSEGLAPVTKKNMTGFINKTGEVVIDFRFDAAMQFFDGIARVKEGGKWMEIDRDGKILKLY